jgi:tetratricopeptide (TPR) repeat protein/tRNA A-37 threonylcarbamoyl transferase component Bud32
MRRLFGVSLALILVCCGPFVSARAPDPDFAGLEDRLSEATGRDRIPILNELALNVCLRSPEVAKDLALEAVDLAVAHDDARGEAVARKVLGVVSIIEGDQHSALEHSTRALEIFEALDDSVELSRVLNNIGIAHRMLDDHDRAIEAYARAMAIDEQLGDREGMARTLGNIANIHFDLSRYNEALEKHLEALSIARELEDPNATASSLNNIAIIYYELGDYEPALEHHLQALTLREDMGDRHGIASSLYNIGNIHSEMGDFDSALEEYERFLQSALERGDPVSEARARNAIGGVYIALEDHRRAEEHFLRSLEILKETGNRSGVADALDNLGLCRRASGAPSSALQAHLEALEIREAIGDERGLANTCNDIGRLYTEMDRPADAVRFLGRGLEVAERVGAKEIARESHWHLHSEAVARGDFERAVEHLLRYGELRDELLDERTREKIAGLEVRYQAEAREREITLLEQDNEIRRLETSRARLRANLMAVGIIVLLLVIGWLARRTHSLFVFWRRRSRIGHYRIIDRIGAGGMGVIYRAVDVMDASRTVALKVVREDQAGDETVRRRFLHEAAVVDQLDHPNIVAVYERGEHDGRLFMAMELLDGPSLAELISRGERLPLAECVHIMRQLTDAVIRIHERGVVHRDLKPENVIVVEHDGDPCRVKLLDFGLARTDSLTRLTQTGMIVGTIGYLSPEQITDQAATAASDVYALGVICYQLLTLRPPFPGETPVEMIREILEVAPVAPRSLRPGIPQVLDELVLAMLAKAPESRPADREVAEALAGISANTDGF